MPICSLQCFSFLSTSSPLRISPEFSPKFSPERLKAKNIDPIANHSFLQKTQ